MPVYILWKSRLIDFTLIVFTGWIIFKAQNVASKRFGFEFKVAKDWSEMVQGKVKQLIPPRIPKHQLRCPGARVIQASNRLDPMSWTTSNSGLHNWWLTISASYFSMNFFRWNVVFSGPLSFIIEKPIFNKENLGTINEH